MRFLSVGALELLLAATTSAVFNHGGGMQIGPIEDTDLEGTSGMNGWGTFDQLLDHSNPRLGTFKQRYWYGTQYWKGPGSPIIMVNPGEQAADGFNRTYTTENRLPGLFAKTVGAAVVILEHRYWGESSPFQNLTIPNLRYLTLENSIKDNGYFARNFDAPFDTSGRSFPDKAPWVYSGGSYPGALAGWIAAKDPGTFWAYHGTSGVVEAVSDFWQYFVPVMEATPKNCSQDLQQVISYVDEVLLHGKPGEKQCLKAKFMLEGLEDADFAAALENGPWMWQSTQFYIESTLGYNPYYQFCDYIENVWPNSTNPVPGPEGVGRSKALQGYAKWFKEVQLPGTCESYGYDEWKGENNIMCYANLNASSPFYKDIGVGNSVNRQWMWLLCNEPFEYWQDGAPKDQPTIVSRLVNPAYWRAQCSLMFPSSEGGYGLLRGKTAQEVNAYTGGWSVDLNKTRLMFANGELDPWRDSTVSSDFRPGGPEKSPNVRVIPGGVHCSDFYSQNWAVNAELKSIVDEEVASIEEWVNEFYDHKHGTREWTA